METETALLWGFVVLMLLVLATIIGLLIHSGLLSPVDVKTCKPDIGELKIAYRFAQGPYKEAGSLFTHVHTLMPNYRTIGVYYDDPKKKQAHKLRYIVGVILSENGSPTKPEEERLLEEHGYRMITFPAINHAVQTSFPFASTISIIVAIMKVYPALGYYVENRQLCAHPFIEVYDNEKSQILFVGPLERQDDFYVPEVQEDEDEMQDDDGDLATEASSRSRDESASFIRSGTGNTGTETGTEYNDSECSESVADDSSSHQVIPPVEPSSVAEMPPPPPPPAPAAAAISASASTPSQQPPVPQTDDIDEATSRSDDNSSSVIAPVANIQEDLENVSGGAEGSDSDANTGSSFEEIDDATAALLPSMDIPQGDEKSSTATTTKEDEGER